MSDYVIIGNSIAAAGCIEGIRSRDKSGSITVIGREEYPVYSRPLISYLLGGKVEEKNIGYRGADFYEKNRVKTLLGKTVISLDTAAKKVVFEGGEESYEKLLVATGSKPFVPPVAGLDAVSCKHTFYTLNDAKALDKVAVSSARVLIVGAGLIGLKCAEGICKKVASVTVVDLAERVMSSVLDEGASAHVKAHCEKSGIRFLLGVSVQEFSANSARLTDGKDVPFDVLVMAIGVRPECSLVESAGGAVNRGIEVDCRMQTSLSCVYAAGDCTLSDDVANGTRHTLALLPNAYAQGEVAGVNMAGGDAEYKNAIPMNAMGLFGLHLITAGAYSGDAYEDCSAGYKKLFYRDNRLVGYILVGNIEKAGIYTSLIRDRVPLDTIDFPLICEKPGLMAFSSEERKAILGGNKR